jgi:hypothetical protein
MKLVELFVWSDSNRFSRKENRKNKMATEGHRYARRRTSELWIQEDIDEELAYIKREIVRLELKLWQDKNMVQVCEPEAEEGLKNFEIEMRSTEDLKNCHEGRDEIPDYPMGNKLRSLRGLTDCQEDSQGISHFPAGQ